MVWQSKREVLVASGTCSSVVCGPRVPAIAGTDPATGQLGAKSQCCQVLAPPESLHDQLVGVAVSRSMQWLAVSRVNRQP